MSPTVTVRAVCEPVGPSYVALLRPLGDLLRGVALAWDRGFLGPNRCPSCGSEFVYCGGERLRFCPLGIAGLCPFLVDDPLGELD